MNGCVYFVKVPYVVVHIVGEDDDVVQKEEESLPFLICKYDIKRVFK